MTTCPRCGAAKDTEQLYCRLCMYALAILHVLQRKHVGRLSAATRERLCHITGLGDRMVRRIIAEKLRDLGEPVCTARRGYYYPETDSDWDRLEAMYEQLERTSRWRRMNIQRRRAEWIGGQTVNAEVEWAAVEAKLIA